MDHLGLLLLMVTMLLLNGINNFQKHLNSVLHTYYKMKRDKEFDKLVKKLKPSIICDKIQCKICKKYFTKEHGAEKYCNDVCRKIGLKVTNKISNDKNRKKNNDKNVIRNQIRNNIKNPSCTFCQGNKCVKKSIKFQDFDFFPNGGMCSIRPRNKCPSFKPRNPEVWRFILKNKLMDEKMNDLSEKKK